MRTRRHTGHLTMLIIGVAILEASHLPQPAWTILSHIRKG